LTADSAESDHALPNPSVTDALWLESLRKLSKTNPAEARQAVWDWFQTLQAPSQNHRLDWLFAQGIAPTGPEGDCEGIVMNLYGSFWLAGLDRLVRLGQLLGGIGWTGKTFNSDGSGYNRLTRTSRIPAFMTMPTYRFRRINGELVGFDFFHSIEPSPLAPYQPVRAIKYDAAQHNNPLVLPRTRDELVQVIPGVYLGRATLRSGNNWKVVGYFGLRSPQRGR
jgi:hypothetical protein